MNKDDSKKHQFSACRRPMHFSSNVASYRPYWVQWRSTIGITDKQHTAYSVPTRPLNAPATLQDTAIYLTLSPRRFYLRRSSSLITLCLMTSVDFSLFQLFRIFIVDELAVKISCSARQLYFTILHDSRK